MPESEVDCVIPPSQSLVCSVCQEVYTNATISSRCSHTFCYVCIQQCLERERQCPLCRAPLSDADLHVNLAIANIISELPTYCPNRPLGCESIQRLDVRDQHISQCRWKPTACPYNLLGCKFTGPACDLDEHISTCVYVQLEPYITSVNHRLQSLEQKCQDQERELVRSREYVRRCPDEVAVSPSASPTEESVTRQESAIDTWPNNQLQCQRTVKLHSSGVTSLTSFQGIIFAGGHDGTVQVFDIQTARVQHTVKPHHYSVWALAYSPSNSRLFTGSSDKTIRVLETQVDFTSSIVSSTITGHEGKIYSLLLHRDRLYSASSDSTIKIWDTASLQEQQTLRGHSDNVNGLAILDDSKLVSASSDKSVTVWDIVSGQQIIKMQSHGSEVLDVATGNGCIFASNYDASIEIYDARTGNSTTTLTGHNWEVWQVEYTQGVLFSGSFDHTVKRWDLRNNTCNATLREHKGYVHSMITTESNLVTGCADRAVRMFG